MITSSPGSQTETVSRLRWLMIGLAFLATVINYLDRQTLSVVAPVLRDQFQMSNVAYSRVVFAFMLAYTIMNGVSGPLIDRLGTRRGYALCIFWWSGASVLHAFSTNAWTLGLYRFLLGMGEAGNWPAAVKVVAEWFPTKERALASGIFNSGSSIGAVVAPPVVAWITLQFGWRQAFLLVGVSGFIWLLLWGAFYRTPAAAVKEVSERPPPALGLLRQRFVWTLTLAKVFFDPVWYFYIFWFPQYLSSARHFDLTSIGKYAWIPFLTADIGNFLGGLFSAALLRRGLPLSLTRKLSMTVFAVLMTSAIPAVLVSNVWVAIGLVSTATFGYTACLANMLSLPSDAYPKNAVASIWGIASMGSGFGGMLFALLTGWVVDHFSYVPVFIGFGILPLISASLLLFVMGPIRPLGSVKRS
jgi:ACS family hexuronate transporter-like MFS transporter